MDGFTNSTNNNELMSTCPSSITFKPGPHAPLLASQNTFQESNSPQRQDNPNLPVIG